jgi:hypothetical protein
LLLGMLLSFYIDMNDKEGADGNSPIGDTEGMSRLTAKGANIEAQIPLGRQGKRGTSFLYDLSHRLTVDRGYSKYGRLPLLTSSNMDYRFRDGMSSPLSLICIRTDK